LKKAIQQTGNWQVRWTCTPAEWRAYQRETSGNKNLFQRLARFGKSLFKTGIPDITFSPGSIRVGGRRVFYRKEHGPGLVDLQASGPVNLICIRFRKEGEGESAIQLPVPKGKLREALEIRERFSEPPDHSMD